MSMSFLAHSAIEGVKASGSLVLHCKICFDMFLNNSFSIEYITSSIHYQSKTNECLYNHCQLFFKLHVKENSTIWSVIPTPIDGIWIEGSEDIENILSETNSGGIDRATKTRSIFSQIINNFQIKLIFFATKN